MQQTMERLKTMEQEISGFREQEKKQVQAMELEQNSWKEFAEQTKMLMSM